MANIQWRPKMRVYGETPTADGGYKNFVHCEVYINDAGRYCVIEEDGTKKYFGLDYNKAKAYVIRTNNMLYPPDKNSTMEVIEYA